MARKPRIHFERAIYHVMMRGNNRQKIFYNPAQNEKFIRMLVETINKYNGHIHAYCLMSNHVHLLLQVNKTPLWIIMKSISYRYSRWLNHSNGWIGHIFQGRYKSILIGSEEYLLQLCRYIHLNPVKANIVKKAEQYQWSSHRDYLGLKNNTWLTQSLIREALDSKHFNYAGSYEMLMSELDVNAKFEPKLSIDAAGKVVINDVVAKQYTTTSPCNQNKVKINLIISSVCKLTGLSLNKLQARGKGRSAARARASIALLNQRHGDASLLHLSALFNRCEPTLSNAASRLILACNKNPDINDYFNQLEKEILKLPAE